MNELPKGWINAMFMNVFDIQGGTQPPKSSFIYEPQEGYIQLLQIRDFGERSVPTYIRNTNTLKKCSEQDILIARYGASLGRILTGLSGAYNVAMAKVDIPEEFDTRFVYYLLRSELFQAPLRLVSRSAQNGFNKQDLEQFEIPIAPLVEQKRIADKLDALLARVDRARTRLDRVPLILKRFRQAVLSAATSGQLTEDWRGTSEYKSYIHSAEIPTSWNALKIKDVADVRGGKRLPNGEKLTNENTGYPYIRAGQLKNGTVMPNDQMYLSKEIQKAISRYTVQKDDIYITIVGACIGDAGIIPAQYDGANLTENAAKLCNFKQPLESNFVSYWLRSPCLQMEIDQQIKSGAQGKLALSRINELDFPLPPLAEQHEIVRRVETLFAFADRLQARYQAARSQVDQLTPALLAQAFRGELVPQDPNDEPAALLLERIRKNLGK